MNFTNLFSINLLAKTIIIGEVPVYWRRGGSATFDLLLQNSSITKQKSIGSFIVTLMNSPITKQKSIGSFIVTLMNSPITKRCFVIAFSPFGRRTSFLSGRRISVHVFEIPHTGLTLAPTGVDLRFGMTLLVLFAYLSFRSVGRNLLSVIC